MSTIIDTRYLVEKDVRELFELHYPKLVSFACKFVGKPAAEDLVQDVFVQLLTKCGKVTINITLISYVYRSVKNKYYDHLKSREVHDRFIERSANLAKEELLYCNPEIQYDDFDQCRTRSLYQAIEALPPKCREIMKAKYLDGKKNPEISSELGMSIRTVETHAYKALRQLKVSLGRVSLLLNIYFYFF